jgi:hypothetical protein
MLFALGWHNQIAFNKYPASIGVTKTTCGHHIYGDVHSTDVRAQCTAVPTEPALEQHNTKERQTQQQQWYSTQEGVDVVVDHWVVKIARSKV